MKILAYFFACLLILSNTTDAEAGGLKEIYTSAEYEISNYYLAGGVWKLEGIDNAEFDYSDDAKYVQINAKTSITNVATGKNKQETCLVSLVLESTDLHSINCF